MMLAVILGSIHVRAQKSGRNRKKPADLGGFFSFFWGSSMNFRWLWGPHDLRNHRTYPMDSPRPFFQASLAPRPGTRWASCQRGSRPCPGHWRSRIDRPRCGEWVQKGRLRQKASHLGSMVAISPGIYGGFTMFYMVLLHLKNYLNFFSAHWMAVMGPNHQPYRFFFGRPWALKCPSRVATASLIEVDDWVYHYLKFGMM